MNPIFRFITIAAIAAPTSALANSWSCSHNDLIRTVEIEYSETSATACNVNYTKATEGFEMQTLWSAENDTSYCEEKAEGFVAKLEGWGWACAQTEAEPEADEATPAAEPEATPAEEAEPAAETPAQAE